MLAACWQIVRNNIHDPRKLNGMFRLDLLLQKSICMFQRIREMEWNGIAALLLGSYNKILKHEINSCYGTFYRFLKFRKYWQHYRGNAWYTLPVKRYWKTSPWRFFLLFLPLCVSTLPACGVNKLRIYMQYNTVHIFDVANYILTSYTPIWSDDEY